MRGGEEGGEKRGPVNCLGWRKKRLCVVCGREKDGGRETARKKTAKQKKIKWTNSMYRSIVSRWCWPLVGDALHFHPPPPYRWAAFSGLLFIRRLSRLPNSFYTRAYSIKS